MSAQETSPKRKGLRAQTSNLLHLERQQRYLATLSRQLNSYHCVPKTITLHEQLENLRRSMRAHAEENESLIRSGRNSGYESAQYLSKCEIQYQKMLRLEREILSYIGKARIHS
jgi:hypothetical protein